MGSRGNCEIVEAKNELKTIQRPRALHPTRAQARDQRPPILKKANNKALDNDINRLFDSINLRTCKSLDLSDSWRNASKKPMRSTGSQSPGIGFSEPVSLKQALRGLCISQAAETAAMKRLSMQASPRVSEAGKPTNLYRSVVVESVGSGCSSSGGGGNRTEMSHHIEESTSYSPASLIKSHQGSSKKAVSQSACSSPSYSRKPNIKSMENISTESRHCFSECSGYNVGTAKYSSNKLARKTQDPKMESANQSMISTVYTPTLFPTKDAKSSPGLDHIVHASETDEQLLKIECSNEHKHDLVPVLSQHSSDNVPKPEKKISSSSKITTVPGEDSTTPSRIANKAVPKLKQKSKLQTVPSSSAVRSTKDVKATRNSSRNVKPVVRSKNVVIKKAKKVRVSIDGKSKTSSEVKNGVDQRQGKLICQRCQCSLNDATTDSSNGPLETNITEEFTDIRNKSDLVLPCWEKRGAPVISNNTIPKSAEKGDTSQSSKTSICDFSSGTTSLSEDNSLSGSTCSNRPHMSKDTRWRVINRIKKQCGFLGLNHFNLLEKLGSGDIGTVYLAELIGTNFPFAIKVMDNEFLARRKKVPRAQTEREILSMLDHPFLPTLYGQFTSDNLSCLIMEFCPGGDLHVLRQKQPGRYFTEQAARFYVAEVLLALEYLHMLGVVYRDLKPENILVREDGHIMLTDFDLSLRCSVNPTLVKSSSFAIDPPRVSGPCAGSNCIDPFCNGPSCKVSCFSPSLTARARKLKSDAAANDRSLLQLVVEPTDARSNSFVGTHEYLAPEIIKGDGHGSAVDWWTFGVLLYELLYGKTPFKGIGNEETLANVVLQNLRFPETPLVSLQARDLIRGLLVKEPENRLGTETGAAEIKRHSFFNGLNWALIRCAIPPQVPELYDAGSSLGKGKRFEFNGNGEHVEFELF